MRRLAGLAAAALTATLLSGCGSSPTTSVAHAYLSAWAAGNIDQAARHTDDPARAARTLSSVRDELHLQAVHAQLGHVSSHGAAGTAEYVATLQLRGVGTWQYTATLALVRSHGHWLVHWTSKDVHPSYDEGTQLVLVRSLPQRAPLLDDHGRPLFTVQPVVNIGLEPSRLHGKDAQTIATVARVLHVDAGPLAAAVKSAKPDAFVPVITLRRAAYAKVKQLIYSLPGTVFTTSTALLPPQTGFARALLGSVGAATADVLKTAGPAYAAGDVLGLSGLQEVYNRRLAGTATSSVVVRQPDGVTIATLKTWPGRAGSGVRTTLDITTQKAAEDALAHEARPAALVAVRASDGAILAAASTPDATSFDRALVGHYPPGSTFKLLTTYALLGSGVRTTDTIACPRMTTIDGKPFRNFEGESGSAASFAHDFAISCNTAFVDASQRLADGALPQTAVTFGVGAQWRLPLDAFSGSVPRPHDPVDKAAEAIGQGRVEVSPLAMALVAAAIDSGHTSSPLLVTDPRQPAGPAPQQLRADTVATLRSLMRLVVTSGTAAGAHLPDGTFGKTGTAEFGTDNPPKTHAWFVGFRGGVAFAVLVDGGGVGGRVAAPIAADFLRRLG